MTVTADDLDAAVRAMVTTLRPAAGRDWSAPAGAVEWDCWHTAEHIGDCLLSYAGQLVAQPTTRYVRFIPWTALLWATGRIALPGRPRVEQWSWRGAPPGENG